ncbi:vacuolar protein-sorting-associated protein 25-like [Styela clava]|uniref:vacuolar protein-sorting-associated protein 25-like n=1 Tax=Styela clava TaxID=7725 RepID=UPI001939F9A6|nr:vacuolar protein-sorting-associated protein 25-like [Styela clava]
MSPASFEWPWQYNFPPFFTIQPNSDTKAKQIDAWCQLVINYHKHHSKSTLRVADVQSSPLFYNKTIDRKLSHEAVIEILNTLHKKGNLEWTDKAKTTCTIIWKTVDQWADLIYAWIFQNGMVNTVFTIFELCHGEESANQEFHGIEDEIFLKALRVLENRRKAELIGNDGIKFFM